VTGSSSAEINGGKRGSFFLFPHTRAWEHGQDKALLSSKEMLSTLYYERELSRWPDLLQKVDD